MPWARLTWDKQKQNEAQRSKLRGQLASVAADEAAKAEDKAAMEEANAVVRQAEQREEARRREAVQHWEEQTVDRIQQNWAKVRERSAEWRRACRQLALCKEAAATARQNWLQLADGRPKAHKKLRR